MEFIRLRASEGCEVRVGCGQGYQRGLLLRLTASWALSQTAQGCVKEAPPTGLRRSLQAHAHGWMDAIANANGNGDVEYPAVLHRHGPGRHTPRGRSTQGRVIFRRQQPVLYTIGDEIGIGYAESAPPPSSRHPNPHVTHTLSQNPRKTP
ncbi:hypothetical protein GGP41_006413 [Bipolaris sorokiniana]|uniref:Uncharacterized protein n=1 Tax=Cochliobolus sativus TaxID=45130 RepID=A0A8H6DVI3_COCSA|nr:hypothetical protein GGP41_006413 [Bipolaris sorokiniana]